MPSLTEVIFEVRFLFRRQQLKNNSCVRPLQPNQRAFPRKYKPQRKVSFHHFASILSVFSNHTFPKSLLPQVVYSVLQYFSEILVIHTVHWKATALFQFPINIPLYHVCLKVSFSQETIIFLLWISVLVADSLFLVVIVMKMIARAVNQGEICVSKTMLLLSPLLQTSNESPYCLDHTTLCYKH